MREVVIVSAVRTPIGAFQGSLASLSAPKLGSIAIKGALERAKLSGDQVDEVIMGCVLSAGVGQAPARQAALAAGLTQSTPCMTINKVCGSGLKAVMLAAQAIRCGDAEVVVAGGMENMSQAPYFMPKARDGFRMGHQKVLDVMIHDGLGDPYGDQHMGKFAELCAREKEIDRKAQDDFARESYERALAAQKAGAFAKEIVPVSVPQRRGEPVIVREDEEPGRGRIDKIPSLRPAFEKSGSVTAANASSINDGAAALVLTSAQYAAEQGVEVVARLTGSQQHAQAPEWFTTAPAEAINKLLEKKRLSVGEIDLFEVNEAFAVVSLAVNSLSGLDPERVNVNGGAVSLGHPIGASGARILVTLLSAMEAREAKRGIATLCIGGGEAVAVLVER
ncbi:MAG: acetyl-CoA C-acetyltransferase [Myxococcota bacterium]|nr:acetyl-CoA C-acetyltransferase [Myxococcota bacterium]